MTADTDARIEPVARAIASKHYGEPAAETGGTRWTLWVPEARAALAAMPEIAALAAENVVFRQALEIIAGDSQCIDNLMSHGDVARAALATEAAP